MTAPISSNFNFEKAFAELNKIVEEMERGDLSLEDSLQAFEKGIQLTRECQQVLKTAEQKVQILMKDNGGNPELTEYKVEE